MVRLTCKNGYAVDTYIDMSLVATFACCKWLDRFVIMMTLACYKWLHRYAIDGFIETSLMVRLTCINGYTVDSYIDMSLVATFVCCKWLHRYAIDGYIDMPLMVTSTYH